MRIGVFGAGAWGTALALVAGRAGGSVTIWAYEPETVDAINRQHENPVFLPGVALDESLRATADMAVAANADALLLVMPAQFMRGLTTALAPVLRDEVPLLICAKGIEQDTGASMTEVLSETLPNNPIAVMSGPTFAADVAKGGPTAVTIAARDPAVAQAFVEAIGSPTFRPYASDDPIGAEIGGAVKNVLAIACGISEGRRLGENARAALITRGLAELTRLCLARGGRAETMMGLAGIGDLALTCTSTKSRNYSLGVALGGGETLEGILKQRRSVAEGVHTAAAVMEMAARLDIEMPICAAVDSVLNHGADIDEVIAGLLARPFRDEGTGGG